jgi:hypothetical protein
MSNKENISTKDNLQHPTYNNNRNRKVMEQGRMGEWAKGRWQQATSNRQQAGKPRWAKGRMGEWAKGRDGERQQQPERLESTAQRNALWLGSA